jgi:hypothetical protein
MARAERKASDEVMGWLAEIEQAKKREKKYRETGKLVREIYDGDKSESTPFNVLYSNTEVMLPSLYSMTPIPVVERRYKDADPLGKASAVAAQRCLSFLLDTSSQEQETFHEVVKGTVLDALLPGRGVASIKYEAELDGDTKKSEWICTESRAWDRVLFGFARKWIKTPWVAYELNIDKAEAKRLFGDKANQIEYSRGEGEEAGEKQNTGERKTALIYQIWDKDGGRKIRYVSPQYPDGYLRVDDDPLKLSGFYNTPRPLMFVEKTNDQIPVSLYVLYENQAKELNNITVRINRIISALKVRGAYDSALGEDLGNIMEADDNQLIPADKSASLAAQGGLDKSIWFMPLEVLIQTLRELYVSREQCKAVIYEIMGISDIARGATDPNETLGAQQIKSQWGVLRLRSKQYEVQRYCRDMMRMMLEAAAGQFSQETWAKMTGLPYLTDMQFQQLSMQAQGVQQQLAALQEITARTGAPDSRMQGLQQQMQQLQQQLSAPKWADVIAMLNDDVQRSYKIDIETNSTIEPEAAQDQKDIAELLQALGQFITGVGPMVQEGIMPFQVAQTMMLSIAKRFRFGGEIEDQIKEMKPPQGNEQVKQMQQQLQQMQEQMGQAKQGQQKAEQQVAEKDLQLKAASESNKLIAKDKDLSVREISLQKDKEVFALQKQVANESVANKSAVESERLNSRKQVMTLEQKQAKAEQQAAKGADAKLSASVKQMAQLTEQLSAMGNALLKAAEAQSEQIQTLTKVASAPRRRRAIRDQNDRIVEAIDEIDSSSLQ